MQPDAKELLEKIYRKRPPQSHKGDFGRVLVIGGSKRYTGAPALAAMAAYKAGSDLVTIAAPRRAADIAASFSPNIITYPLDGDFLKKTHYKELKALIDSADSLLIGNGLGEGGKAAKPLIQKIKKPIVIDADALKYIPKRSSSKSIILTPHAREFEIMTGIKIKSLSEKEKTKAVKRAAAFFGATILLKGHADIISNGKAVYLNRTGNPYMTKGGTGDTLAGICAALLARGVNPLEAAYAAAYINGSAGDFAAEKHGEGMLATDVIEEIPEAISCFLKPLRR